MSFLDKMFNGVAVFVLQNLTDYIGRIYSLESLYKNIIIYIPGISILVALIIVTKLNNQ